MHTVDRVKEFHEAFGIPRVDKTPEQILDGRLRLIWEEFQEVVDAAGYKLLLAGDMILLYKQRKTFDEAHLLKELADLDYVVAGTAEVFKWDFEEAGKRVHESNMGKIWADGTVQYRADGKVLKPDTYQPPDLKDLV